MAKRIAYGRARLAFEAGSWREARSSFAGLLAGDPAAPIFAYYLGAIAYRDGRYGEARFFFNKARDLDQNDRASSGLNSTIREMAAQRRFRLADAEQGFESAARHGVPGFDLFIDPCHPRPPAYRFIARAVSRAMEECLPGLGRPDWRSFDKREATIVRSLAAGDDIIGSLITTGYITASEFSGWGVFTESTESYFEAAFRLARQQALKSLRDPATVASSIKGVFSPKAIGSSEGKRTRDYGMLHAAVALRRLGVTAESEDILAGILAEEKCGPVAGLALVESAVTAHFRHDPVAQKRFLDEARSADPAVVSNPLFAVLTSSGRAAGN